MAKMLLVAIFLLFSNVSFTLCRNLLMENTTLFEGDITEINFDPFEIYETSPADVQSAAGGRLSRRWPQATIPYEFAPNYDMNSRAKVEEGIRYFMQTVPCIKIIPRRPSDQNYVRIINGNGCFAPIGMRPGMQDMSLGIPGCLGRGIVVHEFLHSLGVFHEQSRPDRDNFVTILTQNIQRDMLHNFDKFSTNEIFTDTPYDYSSVMHYERKAFTINGQDTIVPKQNVNIGQRDGLSQIDIIGINRLYGCGIITDCRDTNTNCQAWARVGECQRNPGYMLTNCCLSCRNSITNCRDTNTNCRSWARIGECQRNPGYMLINCCQSCRNPNSNIENKYTHLAVIWQYNEEKNFVWHTGCDFKTNNYKNITSSQDMCVKYCQKSKRCTHFTYNPRSSRCILREKQIKRKNILKIESEEVICGYPYQCKDKDKDCAIMANNGECKTNRNFMFMTCCKSCRNKNIGKV